MAEKVTLESLDGRMDKTDERLDRIESDVETLKLDVGTLKPQMISLQTKSMTSAVWEALNQLTLSRTYEKRLARLETAVFGKVGD